MVSLDSQLETDATMCIEQVQDWLLEHFVAQSSVEQLLLNQLEVPCDVFRGHNEANQVFLMILLNVLVPNEINAKELLVY